MTVDQSNGPPEPAQSKLDELREKVSSSVHQLGTLLSAFKAPLPTQTGNGTSITAIPEDTLESYLKDIVQDIPKLGPTSLETLFEVQKKMLLKQPADDRKYLMEKLIQAATKISGDPIGDKITDGFLTTLWNDLDHPPEMSMGDEYQYRKADGSYNSFLHPQLGAAGQPYARSVKPTTLQPGSLPSPEVIFDSVLARRKPEPHPNRISSMLFYLASIIIHDLFRTDHVDYRLSNTSSYLDLSPLYGSNPKEQERMRTFENGKIKPDCFSETRLLSFPPGVGALLIMYNRFHNYVVEQLALINEGGRFTKPTTEDAPKLKKYDEDLFQTGRLVTCGLYINTIMIDYVRTILNLNRTDSNWQLDPRTEIPNGPALGVGNQVSAEFNLVYRWHAAISDRDDKWTQDLFAELFDGKKADQVPQAEFLQKLMELEITLTKLDPQARPFAKLERKNGVFDDNDLVEILVGGVEDCANAYGPRQIPLVMKAIEVLGMQQARSWNLATLNEFRKHFALTPHETFEDITRDPETAEALKRLYDTPDNVELYPGLVVEDAKEPKVPGSGLCPSYTVSRAILSDAVALVRGDRFYTTSYHPKALTNWGFSEASYDTTIDNGCVFYKLFLRAFPNNFDTNSVYVHYPLTVPSEMKKVLTGLGKDKLYTFERPAPLVQPQLIFSYAAAKQILEDQDSFHVTWGSTIEDLFGPRSTNFMLSGDGAPNKKSREFMENAMYMGPFSRSKPTGSEKWLQEVRSYYEAKTTELLQQKSYKLAGMNQVDLIRDVGNLVHVHFCADMFALPLKTEANPHGLLTEQQLYLIMAAVFTCVFFDADPAHSFPLRQQARAATQQLGQLIVAELDVVKATGKFSDDIAHVLDREKSPLRDYGMHMVHRLLDSGMDVPDLVWGNIMGTAGGMVANQGQLFAQAFDYYMTEGREHWSAIVALANEDTPEADEKLMHYFLEGARMYGETGVFRWVEKDVTVKDYERTLELKKGDKVFVALRANSRDPIAFPEPDKVDLNRPVESYIHLGHGVHQCLGQPMTNVAITTVLKVVARLPGLRPATVWTGKSEEARIRKVMRPYYEGDTLPESWHYHAYLTENWDMYFPFPTTLKVNWDDKPTGASGSKMSNGT